MRNKMMRRYAFRRAIVALPLLLVTVLVPLYVIEPAAAQNQIITQEKRLGADFYPEEGCPVRPADIRVILDVDPFGAPAACRIYITYTNNCAKPISAVKFRCRFADNLGKDRGTFHAIDTPSLGPLAPGSSRSQKWKREAALSPSICAFQIRALQVLYQDGSSWQSAKMEELATPEGTPQWQEGGAQGQALPNQSVPTGQTMQGQSMPQTGQPAAAAPGDPAANTDQRGQQSLWAQPELPTPPPQQQISPQIQGLSLDQSPQALSPGTPPSPPPVDTKAQEQQRKAKENELPW